MTTLEKTGAIYVGGVPVHLLAEGDAIVRMTRNGKVWEPETRSAWDRLLRPGELVMDVGAYTGIYSIASALLGAKVLAIEPHPANFRRLKANAAINSVKVDALWMAASNTNEVVQLGFNTPADQVNDTAWLGEGSNKIPVVAKRIDDLVFRERLCLLKVDVEHYESSVLAGALKTIWTHQPIIVVETLSKAETETIVGMLAGIGYTEAFLFDQRNHMFTMKSVLG
jgi:FkbM family methyltransferase